MRRAIRPFLSMLVLGSAVALSGCVVITSQSSQQLNTIGAVRLTTTVCFSQQAGCPDKGNSNTAGPGGFQVLLGYRVPANASTPQTITTSAGQPLSFTRDSSYTSELDRLAPTAGSHKWVGYRSTQIAGLASPSFTVNPSFALKQGNGGQPFDGPFTYRVVTGARATPENNANAPIDCGSNLAGSSASKTTCVDSPPVSEIATNLQQSTQDLGILNESGPQRADRGGAAPVPFKIVYAGKGSTGPTVSLRASTNVPGASVKPVPSTLTPSGGTSRARAVLQLPPDTPTGSYDVTLIATTPNGQVRSRTRELKVGQKRGAGCGRATATITGTRRADRLVGTRHRDVIAGFGGNDRIFGRGGNDLICAGAGNDFVRGGPGNDTVAGRAGRDMLIGGTGSDVLIGGRGKDRFRH